MNQIEFWASPLLKKQRPEEPIVETTPVETEEAKQQEPVPINSKGWDSLLRLFNSQFFDEWLCITYLYRNQTPGVQDYLSNRLFTLPDEALDRFMSQLCAFASQRPGSPLDRVLVELANRSLRLAVKAYWILRAISEDHPNNSHVRKLRGQVKHAAMTGKWRPPFRHAVIPLEPPFGALARPSGSLHVRSGSTTPLLSDLGDEGVTTPGSYAAGAAAGHAPHLLAGAMPGRVRSFTVRRDSQGSTIGAADLAAAGVLSGASSMGVTPPGHVEIPVSGDVSPVPASSRLASRSNSLAKGLCDLASPPTDREPHAAGPSNLSQQISAAEIEAALGAAGARHSGSGSAAASAPGPAAPTHTRMGSGVLSGWTALLQPMSATVTPRRTEGWNGDEAAGAAHAGPAAAATPSTVTHPLPPGFPPSSLSLGATAPMQVGLGPGTPRAVTVEPVSPPHSRPLSPPLRGPGFPTASHVSGQGRDPHPATGADFVSPNRMRQTTLHNTLDYVEALTLASDSLKNRRADERLRLLQGALERMNTEIEQASCQGYSVIFPMFTASERVLRMPPAEPILLSSREKAPYMLCVEVLTNEADASDARSLRDDLQDGVIIEDYRPMFSGLTEAGAMHPWWGHHGLAEGDDEGDGEDPDGALPPLPTSSLGEMGPSRALDFGGGPPHPLSPTSGGGGILSGPESPDGSSGSGDPRGPRSSSDETASNASDSMSQTSTGSFFWRWTGKLLRRSAVPDLPGGSRASTPAAADGANGIGNGSGIVYGPGGAASGYPSASYRSSLEGATGPTFSLGPAATGDAAAHAAAAQGAQGQGPRSLLDSSVLLNRPSGSIRPRSSPSPLGSSAALIIEDPAFPAPGSQKPPRPPSANVALERDPSLPRDSGSTISGISISRPFGDSASSLEGPGGRINGVNGAGPGPGSVAAAAAAALQKVSVSRFHSSRVDQALRALRGEHPLVELKIEVLRDPSDDEGGAMSDTDSEAGDDGGPAGGGAGASQEGAEPGEEASPRVRGPSQNGAGAGAGAGAVPGSPSQGHGSAPAPSGGSGLSSRILCALGLCTTLPKRRRARATARGGPYVRIRLQLVGGLDLRINSPKRDRRRIPSMEAINMMAEQHKVASPAPSPHLSLRPPTPSVSSFVPSSVAAADTAAADHRASLATSELRKQAIFGAHHHQNHMAAAAAPGSDPRRRRDVILRVFGESWDDKVRRVRARSPYGHLPNWALRQVIVKSGDDCRQELLAVQLLRQFRDVFRDEGLPLWVRPYEVLVVSSRSALIEVVPNAVSIHQVKARLAPQVGMASLKDHFAAAYGLDTPEGLRARRNFVESMAAYSIVCYLMQVKDRHNANILLDADGHIVHIDFGFMLSNSPGGVNFESAPFKLTRDLLEVMGVDAQGRPTDPHELFDYFKVLCIEGFLAVRKHSDRLLLLIEMMKDSGCPCFEGGPRALASLRKRFHLGLTEEQCIQLVLGLISESMDAWRTRQYDYYQRVLNGILS